LAEITLTITARERSEIEKIARIEGDRVGRIAPVSVDEMAQALLQAHLILIRDCGGILPGSGPKLKPQGAEKISGKRGVSLSGGCNGKL
jgi:hypothetical protein